MKKIGLTLKEGYLGVKKIMPIKLPLIDANFVD
jgi:hypothetical protein